MRLAATTFCLLLASALLLGCRATPAADAGAAPAVLTFSPDRYPAVHAAAVEVLRQHGFRIARNDYRFGTITTYPKESPTAAEFWIDDATTRDQRRSDTLNAQQRSVTVRVEQHEAQPGYTLTIEVLIERLQLPERYLTHSASSRITTSYSAVPTHLSSRGIDGPYAQPLTRDTELEARLIEAIQAAVATTNASRDDGVNPRSETLNVQIELARSMLESLNHDPLTVKQRRENPELAMLDRFQREQVFNKLFELLDRLMSKYPEDKAVSALHERVVSDYAEFEKISVMD